MDRQNWSPLKHLQVGRYAEYFLKMEFTLHRFDVYQAEVDDKGIDFVVRKVVKAVNLESLAARNTRAFAVARFTGFHASRCSPWDSRPRLYASACSAGSLISFNHGRT